MGRVEFDGDWEEHVTAAADRLFEERLGPDIARDARRYCPVDTGSLKESVEHHVNDHVLVVSATGSHEREYAVYVEMGHRVFHPSTHITGPQVVPPEPFLRPALYQQRHD